MVLMPLKNTSLHKNNLIYIIKQVCFKTRSPPASLPSITVKWPIRNNGYAKFWGVTKVHYGLCENGEWSVNFL